MSTMTDADLIAQYGGYTDEELRSFIASGIPDWQKRCFEHLITLRAIDAAAPACLPSGLRYLAPFALWVTGIVLLIISSYVFPGGMCLGAFVAITVAMVISLFRLVRRRSQSLRLTGFLLHLAGVVFALVLLPWIGFQFVQGAVGSSLASTRVSTGGAPASRPSPQDEFLKEGRATDPDFDKPSATVDSGFLQRLQSNPNAFSEIPDAGKAADPSLNEALKRQYPPETYAPDYKQFGQRQPSNF